MNYLADVMQVTSALWDVCSSFDMHKGQFINNSGIIKRHVAFGCACRWLHHHYYHPCSIPHKNKDAFLATAFVVVVVVVVSFASLGSLLFHIPISFLLNDLTTWLNVACALYTPLKKHFFHIILVSFYPQNTRWCRALQQLDGLCTQDPSLFLLLCCISRISPWFHTVFLFLFW